MTNKTLLIATKNTGKAEEFKALFKSRGYEIKTLLDFPELEDVEETGTTFEENALLKAETISKVLNQLVIADDSGLRVSALGGMPGVYSARYAGEQKMMQATMQSYWLILEKKIVQIALHHSTVHWQWLIQKKNRLLYMDKWMV